MIRGYDINISNFKMTNKRLIFRFAVLFLITVNAITSCKKDSPGTDYSYFVSKEFSISYNTGYINNLIGITAGTYPGINDLKPFISSDVNVYKLIYKTIINDETINASGLICIPSTPGEYPVMCFQNGTNTRNDYAPSKFVINPSYQLL